LSFPIETIIFGGFAAFVTLLTFYRLASWLQLAKWEKTKFKQQLYHSGETVVPKKRRYLEKTYVWISYFSIAHIIGFMFATLFILSLVNTIDIIYPILYFAITVFSVLTLAKQTESPT
jgi:hypothetical protein